MMAYKSVNDVAEIFNIHASTVKRLIYEGEIKAIKIGGQWKITEEEVQRLIDEGSTK